ncbi:hypothetical protein TNCV_3226681 [Trichonephila clavipes]|nr:hypothetical protein TNCV_3226681 [Trichonephila clavipes]
MQDVLCLLALAVSLRFAPAPSLRPPLAILFLLEARPPELVSSLATFLCLPRLPQFVFSVGIGLTSKNAAAGYENSVMTFAELCASVTWPKLL